MDVAAGRPATAQAAIPEIRFSTENFPTRERDTALREIFGRHIINVEFASLNDAPLRADLLARGLPGLGVVNFKASSNFMAHRTPSLISRGEDQVIVTIIKQGTLDLSQFDRHTVIEAGQAAAQTSTKEARTTSLEPAATEATVLSVPRSALVPAVRDLEAACVQRLPVSPTVLLSHYLAAAQNPGMLETPELQRLFVTHVHDILMLSLGATRDAGYLASTRGLRAARLQSLKQDVRANLKKADLSLEMLARRHGISGRYVRLLFASSETSFSDFVRTERLSLSHRMLTNPQYADLTISTIAFEAGFNDLSHFNHAFKRAYGVTPSDVRAMARGTPDEAEA